MDTESGDNDKDGLTVNEEVNSDCLHDHGTGPDLSFIFSSFFKIFLFVPCGGLKLATRQLFSAC